MAVDFALFLNQSQTSVVDPSTRKSLFASDAFSTMFENVARFYRIPGNELPGGRYFLNNQ